MRACILLLGCLLAAGEAPRTGAYKTTFPERHPESLPERMSARNAWGPPSKAAAYDLAKEEFDVFVPATYDGSQAFGLIAFVNSGKGGGLPASYRDLLPKHRLIWVGACNVENERNVIPRMGLTLDGVWNMRKLYRIDPQRIYASGVSGGGRVSSMLSPAYPEVFSGGIFLIGCNGPKFPMVHERAKQLREQAIANRYALLTGSKDFNLPGTKEVFEEWKGLGAKHIDYLEEPGLAHSNPSAEWWEKGIVALDRPLLIQAEALFTQAKALEAKKAYEACLLYRQVGRDFPFAAESVARAEARFVELAPGVDAMLRAEQAKLGTASADKLRAFALRASGFPCQAEAEAQAEANGSKELDALLALPGTALAGKLVKFRVTWQGFACATRAGEAYEELAAKALEPITALPVGKRAKPLAKFLKDWEACPCWTRAKELLEGDLNIELDAILAVEKSRVGKLSAFVKAWPGTAAAARAEQEMQQAAPVPK